MKQAVRIVMIVLVFMAVPQFLHAGVGVSTIVEAGRVEWKLDGDRLGEVDADGDMALLAVGLTVDTFSWDGPMFSYRLFAGPALFHADFEPDLGGEDEFDAAATLGLNIKATEHLLISPWATVRLTGFAGVADDDLGVFDDADLTGYGTALTVGVGFLF